jgi:hypothetical protein
MCREGLLGRRRTRRIRSHLSGCSRCAEIDAGLARLPTLLTLTSVPPMPAEVASRIEAALDAEAAAQPARATEPAAASPARSGAGPARGRPGLSRKILAAAAAAVVVLAGGGYLLTHLPSATSGSSASRAAPPSGEGPAAAAGQPNAAAGDGLTVISSGTDYRPGQLAAQVKTVLAQYAAPAAGAHVPATAEPAPAKQAQSSQARSSQAPGFSGIATLPACVARITAGQRPQLVDEARYDGRAATIIVLPSSARGAGQVWVVGPACSGSHSDVIAHTLLPASR